MEIKIKDEIMLIKRKILNVKDLITDFFNKLN